MSDFIMSFQMPAVLAACLILGYCLKNISAFDRIANEYIPAILAVTGAILGSIANSSLQLETLVAGAMTGLASTGLHQTFKNSIQKLQKEDK